MKNSKQTLKERLLAKFYGFRVKVHPLKYAVILVGTLVTFALLPYYPYATMQDYSAAAFVAFLTAIVASFFERDLN